MKENEVQSAGGKARALIQKEEAKKRIDEYNKNPNLCLNCNKPIIAPYGKTLKDTKKKKFCCRSCASQYSNKFPDKHKNFYQTNSLLKKCSDEDFLKAYDKSSSCTELARSIGYGNHISTKLREQIKDRINQLGLDQYIDRTIPIANMTKRELISRRSNWQSWRSCIQRNARDVYSNSNKPKECIVCCYNKTYEVAHVKSVSSFDDNTLISEINNIDNLIALCPNHHWEYDNNILDIFEYIQ